MNNSEPKLNGLNFNELPFVFSCDKDLKEIQLQTYKEIKRNR